MQPGLRFQLIEIDSCSQISISNCIGNNEINIPHPFIKLVKDSIVSIGSGFNYINSVSQYSALDSEYNCSNIVRAVLSNGMPIVTTAPYILVHTANAVRDSLVSQMPIDSFRINVQPFSPINNYANGAFANGMGVKFGAVSMTTPGMLTTTTDSINGS